ncbi:unnamed protein product [Euphydryas editha]|nr:unnamed protein product [Euphydryas editha]
MVLSATSLEFQDQRDDSCLTYVHDSLLHIDCSDRGLTDLPEGLDTNAQVLLLANNNFATFPSQLEKFSKVEVMDLSGNLLSSSLPAYFQDWNQLTILNLSHNNYDSWLNSVYTFNFIKLDLSKNKINHIDEEAFIRMPRLYLLELSENRLYDILPRIFQQATSLEVLILSRNYFSVVPHFESASLKNLHLSNCQITSFDKNSLKGMPSLLEIDLSINQIETIPDHLASNSLQELDLSYNEIEKLTDSTFSMLPHLAVLNLRGNGFREVWSTSHFASNPFLREVHVKGNRWSCDGFSVNLLLTYEFLTKEPPKVFDKASLICYSPSNVTQMSWQQAYIRTWHADGGSMSSYTIGAVVFGMVIGIILTSFVCRLLMSKNKPVPPRPTSETIVLNGDAIQPRPDSVVLRVPLREDLPPTYDEALLLSTLNSSFRSLPDFIDESDNRERGNRRSRSIGDLTETRPRLDRRSVRQTAVEVRLN